MFTIEEFLNVIDHNLSKLEKTLIQSFNDLEETQFSSDTNVLVIRSGISDSEINISLYAQQDKFDSIEIIDDGTYFDSKIMVGHFLLYNFSKILEADEEQFDDFYFDHDLESKIM